MNTSQTVRTDISTNRLLNDNTQLRQKIQNLGNLNHNKNPQDNKNVYNNYDNNNKAENNSTSSNNEDKNSQNANYSSYYQETQINNTRKINNRDDAHFINFISNNEDDIEKITQETLNRNFVTDESLININNEFKKDFNNIPLRNKFLSNKIHNQSGNNNNINIVNNNELSTSSVFNKEFSIQRLYKLDKKTLVQEYEEVKYELHRLMKVISVLEIDSNKLENELEYYTELCKSNSKIIENFEGELLDIKLKNQKITEENISLKRALKSYEEDKEKLISKISPFDELNKSKISNLESNYKEKISEARSLINEQKCKINELESNIKEEANNTLEIKIYYSKLFTEIQEENEAILNEERIKTKETQEKIESYKESCDLEMKKLKSNLENSIINKDKIIDSLKQEIGYLKNREEILLFTNKNYTSFNNDAKSLLIAIKNKNNLNKNSINSDNNYSQTNINTLPKFISIEDFEEVINHQEQVHHIEVNNIILRNEEMLSEEIKLNNLKIEEKLKSEYLFLTENTRNSLTKAESKIESLKNQIILLENEKDEAINNKNKYMIDVEKISQENNGLSKRITLYSENNKALSEENERLNQILSDKNICENNYNNEIQQLKSTINNLMIKLNQANIANDDATSKFKSIEDKYNQEKVELLKVAKQKEELLNNLIASKEQIENKIIFSDNVNNSLKIENEDLKNQISELKLDLNNIKLDKNRILKENNKLNILFNEFKHEFQNSVNSKTRQLYLQLSFLKHEIKNIINFYSNEKKHILKENEQIIQSSYNQFKKIILNINNKNKTDIINLKQKLIEQDSEISIKYDKIFRDEKQRILSEFENHLTQLTKSNENLIKENNTYKRMSTLANENNSKRKNMSIINIDSFFIANNIKYSQTNEVNNKNKNENSLQSKITDLNNLLLEYKNKLNQTDIENQKLAQNYNNLVEENHRLLKDNDLLKKEIIRCTEVTINYNKLKEMQFQKLEKTENMNENSNYNLGLKGKKDKENIFCELRDKNKLKNINELKNAVSSTIKEYGKSGKNEVKIAQKLDYEIKQMLKDLDNKLN